MDEDYEEEMLPLPPIMTIPREVRGIIYNKVPQSTAVQLRLVCRQWLNEIDDLVEFSTELDDTKPYLKRVLQLRVKKCKIINFLQPPPLGTGTTAFKHPNLIRILKIRTEKISPDNFHYLLSDCSKYLQELSVLLTIPLLTYPYCQNLCYNFDNLRRLHISVSSVPEGGLQGLGGPPKIQDNLFHQLLSHSMPNLRSLKMELRCLGFAQISRFSSLILSFISKHWKSLETLDFDLIQGHGIPPSEVRPLTSSDLELVNFNLLKKLTSLKAIRIVNSTAVAIDLWAELLANQKKLTLIETDILPAPNSLFRQIILNNWDTLVSIDIGDLTIGDENSEDEEEKHRPFDMSLFRNCHNLRKLTLDRNSMKRRTGPERSELINLFELPEFLEDLALNYFLILSDELLILFSSGLGSNLKTLNLTQCGEIGPFGVDGDVLEKIVALQNINFMEISPLNFSDPGEREKLNLILTTFGYTPDHSYLQLSRVANHQPVQVDFDEFEP